MLTDIALLRSPHFNLSNFSALKFLLTMSVIFLRFLDGLKCNFKLITQPEYECQLLLVYFQIILQGIKIMKLSFFVSINMASVRSEPSK